MLPLYFDDLYAKVKSNMNTNVREYLPVAGMVSFLYYHESENSPVRRYTQYTYTSPITVNDHVGSKYAARYGPIGFVDFRRCRVRQL